MHYSEWGEKITAEGLVSLNSRNRLNQRAK